VAHGPSRGVRDILLVKKRLRSDFRFVHRADF
jgi:hypothetical protein